MSDFISIDSIRKNGKKYWQVKSHVDDGEIVIGIAPTKKSGLTKVTIECVLLDEQYKAKQARQKQKKKKYNRAYSYSRPKRDRYARPR